MNLDIDRPKNETDLILSITKNSETLIEITHREVEEHGNLNLTNKEKRFLSNHQFNLMEIGCF